MKIQLLRDSIIGPGKIERPPVEDWQGDAVKSGMVTELNVASAGDVINLKETDANRLIQLGSAKPAPNEPLTQKKKAA